MLWPPRPTFIACKSVKNMRMKQYVVIIFYQDIIVRKFCPCIFPSCHGLFLVLIPCQYHVWLSSYISSGKFRKIREWAKNATIISILFLSRPRTQKKVNFGTLNTHTHTHSSQDHFLFGISPWNRFFQQSDTLPEGEKPIRLIGAGIFGDEISKRKCPHFLI